MARANIVFKYNPEHKWNYHLQMYHFLMTGLNVTVPKKQFDYPLLPPLNMYLPFNASDQCYFGY